MKKILSSLLIAGGMLIASTTIVTVNGKKITDEIVPMYSQLDKQKKEMVKQQLINEELIMQYALKSGVTKDPRFKKLFEAQKKQIAKVYKERFKKNLTKAQIENIKGSLAVKFLLDKKAKSIKVTDKEAKEFYKKNLDKFKFPDSVEIATIATNDKKEAMRIYRKLKKAKDIPAELMKIAKEKGQRGYLGWLPKNVFPKDVFKKIYSAKPGHLIKKPIEVNGVYNVTYLVNKKKAGLAKFKDIKDNLKQLLKQQKLAKWTKEKIEELRKKAIIK